MKEEVLGGHKQEEILKTQLTTKRPGFGFCNQMCKALDFICVGACSTTHLMIPAVLVLSRAAAEDCLQSFPLTFSLCLLIKRSSPDIFLFQPFQIAHLSYRVVRSCLYFFFFREKEVSCIRNAGLGLILDGWARQ